MAFQGTAENMTTLLVASLALFSLFFLLRKKYDSNLPLVFYAVALVFTNVTDSTVSPYLLYCGLILALLLRFEFLNPAFSRVVAFLASGSLSLIIWAFLAQVFGDGSTPF